MQQRAIFLAIAPPAPACFHDRYSWIGYLQIAQGDKKLCAGTRPLLLADDGAPRWNPDFNHCRDCDPATRRERCAQGRCQPHLNARARARAFQAARQAGQPVRSLRAKTGRA